MAKGHICFLNPMVTVNIREATTSHVQENKRANAHARSILVPCINEGFPAQGVGGEQGSAMSRRGPQPGRQRPGDGGLARLRTGAGGSGSADPTGSGKGALSRPRSLDRRVTPSLLIGATSSPLLPPRPPQNTPTSLPTAGRA